MTIELNSDTTTTSLNDKQDYIDIYEELKGMIRYKTNALAGSNDVEKYTKQDYIDTFEELKGMIRYKTNTLMTGSNDVEKYTKQDYIDIYEELTGMVRYKTNTLMTSAYSMFTKNSLPIAVATGAAIIGTVLVMRNR